MVRRLLVPVITLAALVATPVSNSSARVGPGKGSLSKIKHFVVIYEENHSFDNLYGLWEGVNGLANADPAHTTQIGQAGIPYDCLLQDDVNLSALPATCTDSTTGTTFSSAFTNVPFRIDDFIAPTDTTCPPSPSVAFTQPNGWLKGTGSDGGCTRDLVHRFYQEQYQLNGGNQNRYVTGSDAAGLAMGYYDTTQLPIYQYLHGDDHGDDSPRYAILDNFFQGAFGGSFLNHQWLIAGATPTYPGAAETVHSILDDNGMPILLSPPSSQSPVALYTSPATTVRDAQLTAVCPAPLGLACGDFAINTIQPFAQPTSSNPTKLPAQTAPTIGDRLTGAGIDWAWYSGGWSNAAGLVDAPGWTNGPGPTCSDLNSFANPAYPYSPDYLFQFHHQPFAYYANYGPDGAGRSHLKDEAEFTSLLGSSDKKKCSLLPVSFVKPVGEENEHPGYTGEHSGSSHLVDLLTSIEESRCAKDTMVIVTYDEFGGQWDHVPPPGQGGAPGPHDEWGPGTRVPTLIIAPKLRHEFVVDHAQHDTTSILATIEHRFGLAPLSTRDAAVQDLSTVFTARRRA